MPGRSTEVYQEGIIIPPVKLYRRGELMEDIMSLVMANVRTPEERRGDINAQLAALRTGQKRLLELAGKHGTGLLSAGLKALQDYAERRIRKRIAELPDGVFTAEDAPRQRRSDIRTSTGKGKDNDRRRSHDPRFQRQCSAVERQYQCGGTHDLFGVILCHQNIYRP